jgi:hypothetical protein
MKQAIRLNSPAVAISLLALFVALGGTVYAAARAKIDGRTIVLKSLPGNRVKPRSLPANRLKPGAIRAAVASAPLTGAEINEITLSQVPSAGHAESADTALHAIEADTAVNAVNAINAEIVNGHSVGCLPGTRLFAGACWQASPSAAAATAPEAAADCASQGGALPGALELAAFAKVPGVTLDAGDEWTSDIVNFSGADVYGVATVSALGVIRSGFVNGEGISATKKYRCIIPLLR